jgi:dihydrodipicolinate synthase/N-acetylneuraminate lyase
MRALRGIYPATVTAFDDDGAFDAAAMRSYNLMPHLFVQLWDAVQAGETEKVGR